MSQVTQEQKSIFHILTSEAGLRLKNSGPHELGVEPSIFRRELCQKFLSHPQYPDPIIDQFLEALQELFDEDPLQFIMCLKPLSMNGESRFDTTTDSLIRILLGIDFIQSNLIDKLLERLPTFISDSDNDNIESPIPQLILQQLKWLEHTVDPLRLTEKILEMIPITPLDIQREIITNLPEIINDSEQKTVIQTLIELMDQNHRLIVPILDALSNFTVQEDYMNKIHETIFDRLESADLEDLPLVIKFLLQTATSEDAYEIVKQIREKVDFRSIGRLQNEANQSKRNQKKKKEQVPESLILDSIKNGIQFHKFIMDAWIKAINDVKVPTKHMIIDILILLIMHSIPGAKKKVENIFRKKIENGLFTRKLLEEAITCHYEGLQEYFNNIISLSESLLRSSQQQATLARAACSLYKSSFIVYETYEQQEIVASLVTHIGSGSNTEADSALSVLSHLVEADLVKISRFAIFVKGILDYLDNLSVDQIRILFDVLSKLIHEDANNGDGNSGLLSEFSIVIQKQLSNPSEKYKQIGVIGALALVKTLGAKELSSNYDNSNTSSNNSDKRNPFLNVIKENLAKIERHCVRSMACLSFAYDELAHFISHNLLDEDLVIWISDKLASPFQDFFILDDDDVSGYNKEAYHLPQIPIEPWMKIDGELFNNIYPLLCEPYVSTDVRTSLGIKRDWIISSCSMFKLWQACEKAKNKGTLEEIDALLGMGILMYEKQTADHMKSNNYTKLMCETACNALFYAINWFREIVNAFWSQSDIDDATSKKIIRRLQNINELENLLTELLEITPTFQPFGFGIPTQKPVTKVRVISVPVGSSQRNIIRAGKTARRSAISKGKILSARRIEEQEEEQSKINDSAAQFMCAADLRPLMRELEMEIFGILKYGEFKKPQDDYGDNDDEPKDEKYNEVSDDKIRLQPKEIIYLLEDLNRKLEHKISASSMNIPFFAKKSKKNEINTKSKGFGLISRKSALEIVSTVSEKYLPILLNQFESICNLLDPDNDVLLERNELNETQKCLELILEIIHRLVSWSDLKSPDNVQTLINILNQISSKGDSPSSEPTVTSMQRDFLQKFITDAFEYLLKFSSKIPTANLAILFHKILCKINEFAPDPNELSVESGNIARYFVTNQWQDRKQLKPTSIIYLIQQDIHYSMDKIERIKYYADLVLPSLENNEEEVLQENPLFNKDTFQYFYKALSIELIETLREFKMNGTTEEILLQFTGMVYCWQRLVSFIKKNHKRVILSVVLRYGRGFIDLFVKKMLPFMDESFKLHRDVTLTIFKDFQSATRNIQTLCTHVKVAKETMLAAMVPAVKKSLEIVIFQVKAMLQHNGCPPEAFFMGALKFRDIEGNLIDPDMPINEDTRDEVNSVLNDNDDDDGDDEDVEQIDDEEKHEENDDINEVASVTSRSTDKGRKRKDKRKTVSSQFDDDVEMEDYSFEKKDSNKSEDEEVDDVSVAKTDSIDSDIEQDIIDLIDEYNEEEELGSCNRKRGEHVLYSADDDENEGENSEGNNSMNLSLSAVASSSSKSTQKRPRKVKRVK
ncbi:Fanconi anaemia protein FANCD2 [Glomus cerebriforme]|uniref:Fanconi anaemia protein FANCD2 n=1 Tax=Glomus cerebriforme TaxID=658196 RepID=A0A397SPG3_9GLOM|nr:Fanconi anaemia protein FANCD2 [Glomus cerebriforme]